MYLNIIEKRYRDRYIHIYKDRDIETEGGMFCVQAKWYISNKYKYKYIY